MGKRASTGTSCNDLPYIPCHTCHTYVIIAYHTTKHALLVPYHTIPFLTLPYITIPYKRALHFPFVYLFCGYHRTKGTVTLNSRVPSLKSNSKISFVLKAVQYCNGTMFCATCCDVSGNRQNRCKYDATTVAERKS